MQLLETTFYTSGPILLYDARFIICSCIFHCFGCLV